MKLVVSLLAVVISSTTPRLHSPEANGDTRTRINKKITLEVEKSINMDQNQLLVCAYVAQDSTMRCLTYQQFMVLSGAKSRGAY